MVNIKLKSRMLAKGVSGFELARKVGISDSQFSRMVRGWIDLPGDIKLKVADALRCGVDEIFQENEQRNPEELV